MLWTCRECTAAYAVGAPQCPQCGSIDYTEEGRAMPKITRYGGASNAAAGPQVIGGAWTDSEEPDVWAATSEVNETDGSEQSSPGTSSSTSSEKDETSQQPSRPGAPSPARTTASRSKQARTAGSSAAGTDGGPTAPTSAPDHK